MSLDELRQLVRTPPIDTWPEVRWWLAEGLHTDRTLRGEVDAAHRLGFGGMEFLAMDEAGIDHARYGWGSEEWVHASQVVVEETTARHMAVSFTSGTNWSNANLPTITPDEPAAAQELDVVDEWLAGGQRRAGPVKRIDLEAPLPPSPLPFHRGKIREQHLVAVVAAVRDGEGLDAGSVVDLTGEVVDGELDWTAPEQGEWRLFSFWMHGTGQTASPSASINYTVNYLDRAGVDAVTEYWRDVVLTPELRDQIARNGRAQMYMDSLELSTYGAGGLFWSASLPDEFRARRGYDIVPWLPFLTRSVHLMAASTVYHHEPDAARRVAVDKARFDYVRTLTDLYIEKMLRPFAAFLHDHGLTLRSEISYGLPFELTRPGPEVDGIETESLEFGAQIDAYRLLAGPAHLFGKLYSSETGATTRNHILDHRVYDQMIATQLASGITRTVLHGWASIAGAEGSTEWPGHEGMLPMFSERFDLRQPGSEFYPQWTAALARQQVLLRRGRPRVDVGILRTDHFTDNAIGLALVDPDGRRIPDEELFARRLMRAREGLWWQDLGMQDAGWSYEFLDPSLLLRDDVTDEDGVIQPDGPGYQALIVYQSTLDPDAAGKLVELANRGVRILVVHGAREVKLLMEGKHTRHERAAVATPGNDGRDEELAATMRTLTAMPTVTEIDDPAQTVAALRALGVAGRAEFAGDNPSVLTLLRDDGDLTHLFVYHFLYDTGSATTVDITLERPGATYRIDPWSGALHPHGDAGTAGGRFVVSVTLAPGETALLSVDHAAPSRPFVSRTTQVAQLESWDLTVESWDAGPTEILTEDRGLGYETREARPATRITPIPVPEAQLVPWKDLPAVGGEVSGVGEYRSTLRLTDADLAGDAALVLDLGSTCGALGSVSVNGGDPIGFDTSRPRLDVTGQLHEGDNTVIVRVSSSLNNRLLARGYYDHVPDPVAFFSGGEPTTQHTTVADYGLLGPVTLSRVDSDTAG